MSTDVCFGHAKCPWIPEKYKLDNVHRDMAEAGEVCRQREGETWGRGTQDRKPGRWRERGGRRMLGWRYSGWNWRACHRAEGGQKTALIRSQAPEQWVTAEL